MTADVTNTIIIHVGEHIPRRGEKFHSAAEFSVAKKMYQIAYETQSSIMWNTKLNITNRATISDAFKYAIPWHQIDFVLIHEETWTAVEIDGKDFHGVEADGRKDIDLLSNGWNIVRVRAAHAVSNKHDIVGPLTEFVLKNEHGKFLGIPEDMETFDNIQNDIELKTLLRFLIDGPKKVTTLEEML